MKPTICLAIILALVTLAACAPAATAVPSTPTSGASAPGSTAAATPAAPATAAATAAPTAKPGTPAASPTTAAKIKRGGTLRAAVQNDWVTTDPMLNNADAGTIEQLMQPFATWKQDDKGAFGPTPVLATEWQFAEKSITLKLRQGVKFHDGSDWNATVAKFNLDRFATNPKSQQKPALAVIDETKGVEVVDNYTIRVNLKAPSASFLANLSPAGDRPALMVSKDAIDKFGEDRMATNPVGTGPFKFVEWVTGDHMTFNKWENYWEKGEDGQPLPYVETLVTRWINDDTVRLLELRSKNIHVTEIIQGKDVPSVKANPDLVYEDGAWAGNQYRLIFSMVSGPFKDNLKLRQAGLTALDRDSFARTLGQGSGNPNRYWLLPGMLGFDDTLPWYQFDRAKATQLVKDAGFANGLDVTLTVMNRQVDQQQSQIIKQMWDAVGIRTTIEVMERVAWTSRIVTGPGIFDAGTMRNPARGDPDSTLRTFLFTTGSYNAAHFSNPDMDKCITDASSTYDNKQRQDLYRRCQLLDYEQFSYYGQIWVQPWNWVHVKELQGFDHAFTTWDLRRAWIQ